MIGDTSISTESNIEESRTQFKKGAVDIISNITGNNAVAFFISEKNISSEKVLSLDFAGFGNYLQQAYMLNELKIKIDGMIAEILSTTIKSKE